MSITLTPSCPTRAPTQPPTTPWGGMPHFPRVLLPTLHPPTTSSMPAPRSCLASTGVQLYCCCNTHA